MTHAVQLTRLTKLELLLFIREPIGTFFTIAFPVILLLALGSAFGDVDVDIGDFRYVDIYVPALIGMIIANLGLMSLPIVLAEYREQGYLKTLLATPLTWTTMISAQALALGVVALVGTIVVVLVALPVFDIQFGGSVVGVAFLMILGAIAFFACGHLLASIFKTPRSSQAVGSAVFFVMLFLSGAAIPREQFPDWLDTLGSTVPLAQLTDALVNVWTGDPLSEQWGHALYLAIMGAAAIAVTAWLQRRRDF
jgi:ABC-2 type transport system permease protein